MLAAGTGWKVFDFGGHFLNFNGVLSGNEKAKCLVFGIFCNIQCKFY